MDEDMYADYIKDLMRLIIDKAEEAYNTDSNTDTMFTYFDVINLAKEQAHAFNLDFDLLGLGDVDEWKYLKSGTSPQD